MNYLNNPTD